MRGPHLGPEVKCSVCRALGFMWEMYLKLDRTWGVSRALGLLCEVHLGPEVKCSVYRALGFTWEVYLEPERTCGVSRASGLVW